MRLGNDSTIDLPSQRLPSAPVNGIPTQNRKSAREAASRLRAMPKIANAIAELLERKPGMTRTMVVTELAAIAQSDISQYLELADGRLIVKDPATLPKEALRAIRSMREHITERGHVTIEVQLCLDRRHPPATERNGMTLLGTTAPPPPPP